MNSRIEGCFFGQLIGDALGTRYEFKLSDDAKKIILRDLQNNFLPILGEGPFNVGLGQVTDDSELALGLARGIAMKNEYDKELIAKQYLNWYRSMPFDLGRNTRLAFSSANNYNDIINNSYNLCKDSLSNGCLMRISPLAIHGLKLSDAKLITHVRDDCEMTNPNKITVDAVTTYVFATREAILTGDRQKSYLKALEIASNPIVINLLKRATREPNPVFVPKFKKDFNADSEYQGYFGFAFQNAFYQLLHSKNYHDALVETMLLGGDTDTNGCIVGALLGALYGIDKIPNQWIRSVKYPKFKHNREKRYPPILINDYMDILNGLL